MKYNELKQKFLDKGYRDEFYWLVSPEPPFNPSIFNLNLIGLEKAHEIYSKNVQKVYGEEWGYWNTWIDYQKHK